MRLTSLFGTLRFCGHRTSNRIAGGRKYGKNSAPRFGTIRLASIRAQDPRLGFESLEDRRLLSIVGWDTADHPNGGDWDTASNWIGNQVPGPGDVVQIGILNPDASVTHGSNVADSVYSITSQAPIVVSAGSLGLANSSLINNTLVVSGGALSSAAGLSVEGTFTWSGGTVSGGGTGSLTAAGGLDLNGGDGGLILDGVTLNNLANASLTSPGGYLSMADGAIINNPVGATFTFDNGNINNTGSGAPALFNNQGTIIVNGGGGNLGVPLSNQGTIDLLSGQFSLGGGTSSGTISNAGETGATALYVAEMSFTSSSSVSADSVVFYDSCTVAGSYTAQSTEIYGDVNFTNSAVSTSSHPTNSLLSPGNLILDDAVNVNPGGGTADFLATDSTGASLTLPLASLTMQQYGSAGAVLTGSDSFVVSGATDWSSGIISRIGVLTAEGGLNLNGGDGGLILDGVTLNNLANASLTSPGGYLSMADGAIINNPVGATFTFDNGNINNTGIGAPTLFNNLGTIIVNNGGNMDVPLSNQGTIDLLSGQFGLDGGTSSGTITNAGETAPTGLSVLGINFTSSSSVSADSVFFYGSPSTVSGSYAAQTTGIDGNVNFTNSAVSTSSHPTNSVLSPGKLIFAYDQVGDGTADFLATDSTGAPVTLPLASLTLQSFQATTGALTGMDSFVVSGPTVWEGTDIYTGTIAGSGSLTTEGGMNFSGPLVLDGVTLNNPANATANGYFTLSMADGATINNAVGATFTFDSGNIGGTGIGAPTLFNNQGTIIVNNGGNLDVPLSNEGAIDLLSGGFGIAGGTSSGTITNAGETGATLLEVPGMNFTSSSSVSADSVFFYGSPSTVAGSYTAQTTGIDGNVNFTNSEVSTSSHPTNSVLSPGNLIFAYDQVGDGTADFLATDSTGAPVTLPLSSLTVQYFQASSAVLTGNDSFVVSGPTVWDGANSYTSTIRGTGSLTTAGGLTISGGGLVLDGVTLNNLANASLDNLGGGTLSMTDGATINNAAGTTFTFDNGSIGGDATTLFNNQGTIIDNNGGYLDVPLANPGAIDLLSGQFGLGAGTSSGTITNVGETGPTLLTVLGMDFTSTSSVRADTVFFYGSPSTVAGSYAAQTTEIDADVNFTDSAVSTSSHPTNSVLSPGNLIFAAGNQATNGTADFLATDSTSVPVTLPLTSLTLQDTPGGYPGVLTGNDSFVVSGPTVLGSVSYLPTTLSGSGSLTANGGMTIDGNLAINAMTLVNAGNASWLNTGNIQVSNFGQIVNLPGAVFGSPGNGSTISLAQANFLGEGASTVNANLSNAGLVDLTDGSARLTINGNYTQTTGTSVAGTLNIELNGAGAGQYSQLLVNGPVSLAGALDLIPAAGFTTPVGSALTIISGNLTAGTFPGYAEGSIVKLGTSGQPNYTITYHGGTGNNLVLTHVGITDTSPAKSIPVYVGQSTGSQVLATFTDTYPNVSAANISGTINWGDSSSTAFTSTAVTLSGGTFSVSGSHTYATDGAFQVTVTINDGYGDTISTSKTQFIMLAGSIYVLDPTAGGALSLSGNADINTSGNVVVDSNSSSAVLASGNATVTATSVQVVGGVSKSGNAKVTKTGTPTATGNPLAGLAAPTVPTYPGTPVSESVSGNSTATISQGLYSQMSVSGNAKLTLNPGVYVIGTGGVTVSGNATLSGSGVTYIIEGGGFTVSGNAGISGTNVLIDNTTSGTTSGSISLSGNGTLSLSAASSAPDAGILIYQPNANAKALSFSGNAMAGLNGTVYAPSAQLVLSGNANLKDTLVVDTLSISGNAVAQLTAASGGTAYTPAQIRTAYGINNLTLDGTGQTIAIVDAYDDPQIYQALDTFDNQFGLTNSGPTLFQQYGAATSFLTVLNQNGQPTSLPGTDPVGQGGDNWEVEEALDVQWVHAIAPGAKIVLVEANSQSLADLMAGAATAASQPGVSTVSMSWGFAEGQGVLAADEATYDGTFTTPGVTFVASTGDYGAADPVYPAFSPNVLAVGGTSLAINADNSYNGETGWGYSSASVGTFIGSGGGLSRYETEPGYQQRVQSTGSRTTPDVSFVADPATGAWIADPYNLDPSNPWEVVGGTSLSAPCWAGLIALVNQGRSAAGQPALNSAGPNESQQSLYSLSQNDFNVITSGSNGYSAAAGYNLVTGLGTPVANLLVPDLVAGNFPSTGQVPPASAAELVNSGTSGGNAGSTANVMNVFTALTMTGSTNSSPAIQDALTRATSERISKAHDTVLQRQDLATSQNELALLWDWAEFQEQRHSSGAPAGFASAVDKVFELTNCR